MFKEIPSPMGGNMWIGDIKQNDDGYSAVQSFIKKFPHENWSLSIFDTISQSNIEIECDISDMPFIVSHIYNMENGYPMIFIGENPMSESYVVGMNCTKGQLSIPGVYKVENKKLIQKMKYPSK